MPIGHGGAKVLATKCHCPPRRAKASQGEPRRANAWWVLRERYHGQDSWPNLLLRNHTERSPPVGACLLACLPVFLSAAPWHRNGMHGVGAREHKIPGGELLAMYALRRVNSSLPQSGTNSGNDSCPLLSLASSWQLLAPVSWATAARYLVIEARCRPRTWATSCQQASPAVTKPWWP